VRGITGSRDATANRSSCDTCARRGVNRSPTAARPPDETAAVTSEPVLLSGTANPALAGAVAGRLGLRLSRCSIEKSADGEIDVELLDPVRRREVFLVGSTSAPAPDHLLELVAMADACRRAAADRLVAVLPYYGFVRADRRDGRRPVMAALAARILEEAGIGQVITIDLHAPSVEGFFRIPVVHLSAIPLLARAVQPMLGLDVVVVAPDAGAVRLAWAYADALGGPVAILHHRRPTPLQNERLSVSGDVAGRPVLIVDDMIGTGGTILSAIQAVLDAGAAPDISIAATHGVFADAANEKFDFVPAVRRVVCTDTLPQDEQAWPKLHVVSVAGMLAEAIRDVAAPGSLPVRRWEEVWLESILA
jgi:ribose-phosphate pyrophosphokinase